MFAFFSLFSLIKILANVIESFLVVMPTDPPTLADVSALLKPSESKLVKNLSVVTANVASDAHNRKSQEESNDEMIVNAFEVKGVIDYNKLVDQFGSKLIT